MNYSALLM